MSVIISNNHRIRNSLSNLIGVTSLEYFLDFTARKATVSGQRNSPLVCVLKSIYQTSLLVMHLHAGRSPGGQQGPTDGQLGGQVTLSLRLAGNTKEGWAGSWGATECECARLVMAAVNGLEGEADRLCVLLVQPVRHLAGFSLLELLAVFCSHQRNDFSPPPSYPLRSGEVKFVKMFKDV